MSTDNTLTFEKLRAMMDQLPKPDPLDNELFNPFRLPRFAGRQIYEQPPSPPKVQVSQIFLSDGTPLLPGPFLARINHALLERFGRRPGPFDEKIYMLGSWGLAMNSNYARILGSLGP